ncbi:MAG: hypothetical protein IJ099_03650 [Alphaproteobacteria bacterium]|nr:hypothetical protein [Alphaproteobacteria bacterium]
MINNTITFDKNTLQEIGKELWLARWERHLFIYQVAKRSHVPIDLIDTMELGKAIDANALLKLLKFYGKKMRIMIE